MTNQSNDDKKKQAEEAAKKIAEEMELLKRSKERLDDIERRG